MYRALDIFSVAASAIGGRIPMLRSQVLGFVTRVAVTMHDNSGIENVFSESTSNERIRQS